MFLRFLLIGGLGFVIDASLTYLLVRQGIPPWVARVPAIVLAMTFTWLANRYFTYRVKATRSASEALRYAIAAITMAMVNYLIYLILVQNGLPPVMAVTLATACQTAISFYLYKHLVFKV
ncbi:MAG TPA: GtrA family protein [Gallionellaceae bacterium]